MLETENASIKHCAKFKNKFNHADYQHYCFYKKVQI